MVLPTLFSSVLLSRFFAPLLFTPHFTRFKGVNALVAGRPDALRVANQVTQEKVADFAVQKVQVAAQALPNPVYQVGAPGDKLAAGQEEVSPLVVVGHFQSFSLPSTLSHYSSKDKSPSSNKHFDGQPRAEKLSAGWLPG